MAQFKGRSTPSIRTWNSKLRLRTNEVVEHLGSLYQNSTGKNTEPGIVLTDWVHLGIANSNGFVHLNGNETINDVKTFSDNTIFENNIQLNNDIPKITLKENVNNTFIDVRTRDIGNSGLLIKNHNNKNLFIISNPPGSNEPQMAIGDTSSIPTESQFYVYGGQNGANIDMRGKTTRDECNMDFEGSDWATDIPNSLGFSYFGSQYSLGGDVLGYPKNRLAHIRFNEAEHAIITSTNQSGVVPIRFGINGNEIANLSDKGLSYQDDYSADNLSNPRWLVDKDFVNKPSIRTISSTDNLTLNDKTLNISSGTFTVGIITAVGNSGVTFEVMNNGSGIITLDPNSTETINGNSTFIVPSETGIIIKSDGSNWIVVSKTRLKTLHRTQWIQNISTTTIANASSLNLFTLISDANKSANGTDGGIYDLSIATNKILTKWHGEKMTHHIRISSTIAVGTDQHYLLTLRRFVDDSVLGQVQLNRNADTGLFTADFLTYTYSDVDPFVTGGFYIQLDNNSGASVDLTTSINLLIVTYFQ